MDETERQRRLEIFNSDLKQRHLEQAPPVQSVKRTRRDDWDWWLDSTSGRNSIWPRAYKTDLASPLTKCNGMNADQVAAWVKEYMNLVPTVRRRPIRRGPKADEARRKRAARDAHRNWGLYKPKLKEEELEDV